MLINFFSINCDFSLFPIDQKSESSLIDNSIVKIVFPIISILGIALTWTYFSYKKRKKESEFYQNLRLREVHGNIQNLRKGHMIIPFLDKNKMQNYFDSLKKFYSRPMPYLEQFNVNSEIEIGYMSLKRKECFVVRNGEIPIELEDFIPYISEVHKIGLGILLAIEEDLRLKPGELIQTVSKGPLPEHEISPSLLRLFSYAPFLEYGVAAEPHQDIGLLTIIPVSEVPALEILDHSSGYPAWVNIEQLANSSEAIVLVGKTLNIMTQGQYMTCVHQVQKSSSKRYSIVYQMRADPRAKIQHGHEIITIGELMRKLREQTYSINHRK